MGNLQELSVFEQTSFVSNPSFSQIGAERWAVAETAARNIISKLHPTVASHTTRFQVINYLRRLIKNLSGFEVFPYGSCRVSVKEIRLVNAEVKLMKCIVQNIVVDISFSQIVGLCSLCFLDVVDYIIGKDHLFKQSILVIKAWCYYESRILGAHHGLISTYALETLVLYIIQVFHSSLDGPLAVLYKFMDYFSNFDWINYCITLYGPVRLSSLSESGTGIPENVGGPMLLSEEFYRHCMDTYSVPLKEVEMQTRIFPRKHLNIVDPLKEFNNLGRSVSEGSNFIHDRVSKARRHVGTVDVPSVTYSIAFSEELFNTDSSLASANNVASPESLNSMLDLRGRFETQFNILQYGRCFYLFGSNMQDWPVRPPPPHFQSAHSSHAIQRSSLLNRPRFYPINSMISPRASNGLERPRLRGTGTFFPILVCTFLCL
ncbi:hypothetical protein POM88_050361 [Heracleum sosnowskyi]|uniref:PAP/OAS1 substrate-binding-related domain-containing protein n=1 Tax=Heracleum sosnowskyi TaxID=360622 RepID=A0AAD8M0B6_9APIA|nr:hypothetical protein POM88_050361 [Heracleum sosnowskyi]